MGLDACGNDTQGQLTPSREPKTADGRPRPRREGVEKGDAATGEGGRGGVGALCAQPHPFHAAAGLQRARLVACGTALSDAVLAFQVEYGYHRDQLDLIGWLPGVSGTTPGVGHSEWP